MPFTALFIAIDLTAILCLIIGIVTSSLILVIIVQKLGQDRSIAYLMLGNTCLCTLELCLSYLVIYGFILKNDITFAFGTSAIPVGTADQRYFCPIRSYFLFTGFSLLYTSYCLQAYYRLRQVIFYKHRYSYRKFECIIFIQWLISFLLVLPMYLANSFVYIPTEFFCPIPFTRPLSVVYIAVTVYGMFLVIFVTIYVWIYIYTNRTTSIIIQRRRVIDRQLIMLKRILLPTFSLMFLGIIYLCLFFQTLLNHYQTHYLTYRLSYLFIAIGMSFIHMITIHLTPPVKTTLIALLHRQLTLLQRVNYDDTVSSMLVAISPTSAAQHQAHSSQETKIQITTDVIAYQSESVTESAHESTALTSRNC